MNISGFTVLECTQVLRSYFQGHNDELK